LQNVLASRRLYTQIDDLGRSVTCAGHWMLA